MVLLRVLAASALLLFVFAAAPPAHADVILEEEGACRSKEAGAACSLAGESGACVEATCWRNDYSDGPPPKSVEEACLKCEVGAEPTSGATQERSGFARSLLGGCGIASLGSPVPLSLLSLGLGAGLLALLYRRRRRAR